MATVYPISHDQRGITLVELVTVLSVIVLLTGIMLPRIDFGRARVRAAANEVVTILASAQSRAVLNDHDVVIRFDTIAGTLLVHRDADNDGSIDADEFRHVVTLADGVVFGPGPSTSLGSGGAVGFTQRRGGLPSLTFHRNGAASEEGVIHVTAGSRARVSPDEAHVRGIRISRPTGRSVCHRFRSGAWEAVC